MLAERGLDISYETIRRWFLKFGTVIGANLRRTRPKPSDHWHLDEMVIVIQRKRYWLWRAVDNEGEVLDFLVQSRRNARAAKKLMKKLLKKQGFAPSRIVTDKLRSYPAAFRSIGLVAEHDRGLRANNRAENSHLADILRSGEKIGATEPMALPDQPVLVLTIAARLKRTGMEKKLLIGGTNKRSGTKADAGLLKRIARAHELQEIFTRGGRPISEMAEAAGVSSSYFTRVLRLSFLAPDITQAILHGRQPADLNAHKLMADTRAPIDWHEQRAGLGFI
jgi:IS1 family transposase